MFYTYILRDKKGQIYIGYTRDLKKRLLEHNQGLNFSTKNADWQIIYYEACLNQKDATRREKYFKTSQGRRLLKRRLKEFFYQENFKNLTKQNSTTG